MSFKVKFSIVACLLLMTLAFQNCNPNNSQVAFTNTGAKLNNENDSGTPYEGKIYAIKGNLCADGTEVHSEIVLSSATRAQLNRDNCQDITPIQLTEADFKIDSNSDTLIYQNRNYSFIGYGNFDITNFSFTNDSQNFYYSYTYGGAPSFLRIYIDVDNNPATGFSYDGIGADFLIENDNVWKYSAAVGAPQDTWAWTSVVSANKVNVAPNVSWSFSKDTFGSSTLMKIIGQTSLGAQTPIITQIPK